MMNIKKILLVSAGVFFVMSTAVFAKENPRLEQFNQAARQRAETAKQQVLQKRAAMQARIQSAKDAAKERIAEVSDQKKREAATKIVDRLNHVNDVWTDHFTNVLDRLDAVLQKVKSRTEIVSATSADVTTVNAAITNAENKISAARTAVAGQAAKTYALDSSALSGIDQTTLVSGLRSQFKTLRDQLFGDLAKLRDGAMRDARMAVQNAIQTLVTVPNVDQEPADPTNN